MSRTNSLLLTGFRTPFADAFLSKGVTHDLKIASTIPSTTPYSEVITLPAASPSSIGIYSTIVAAHSKLSPIDAAILLNGAEEQTIPYHDRSISNLEQMIDIHIRYNMVFLRELLHYFLKQKHGIIIIVHEHWNVKDPFFAGLYACLAAGIERLQQYYRDESVMLKLIDLPKDYDSQFIDTILDIIEKRTHKRQKQLSTPRSLFSLIKPRGRQ